MFGITYSEEVTIRRARPGSLGVGGRPEFDQVVEAGDESPVRIRCKVQDRGRVTVDARQRTVKTDATLLYCPKGEAVLRNDDIVVRSGDRAYEVVGIETVTGQWGGVSESRVDLVRTAFAVRGDRLG